MEKHSSGISDNSNSGSGSTFITTLLPYTIKGSIPKKLFSSSIFLLRFLNTPQLPPRMVLTAEVSKAGVAEFFDPFTRTLITNLPQNIHLTHLNSTSLTSEYHIVTSNDPFPHDSPFLKALIVDGTSSKCTLLTLFKGGQVYKAYPFDRSDYHAFGKAFESPTIVEDLIIYNDKVYALSHQGIFYLYWVWETVTRFGDGDQVLFVTRDHCFFVPVAELPECHLSNCIVFSDDAFLQYSKSERGWDHESKAGNEVAVFPLEGLGDPYFPIVLWSTPNWLSQNTSSSLQSQAQSRGQSEAGVTQSDFDAKSASEEQTNRTSSSNRVKFQGLDVESEHLPVLEKVRAKYGDVIEGSPICGRDAITIAWTCLAKILVILQSNSEDTLTDEQASYLSTTLSDLKFMQLKVDWLVPFVEKALAMHKMQESLVEIEKAKARAEEMQRDLLSKIAEMRQSSPVRLEDCLDKGPL